MSIRRLDHFSIRTTDLEATRRFYTDVLGFVAGPRPPFDFPGVWLYLPGAVPAELTGTAVGVVHIVGIDPDAPQGLLDYLGERAGSDATGSGTVDHLAFFGDDLADMQARLRDLGISFRDRLVPLLGVHQVFLEDPNGVTIELNYALTA